ncbi:MAG: hypothetical protein O2798_11055 [Chloroflexi bacterium]|nr:hypothetical protein [Chloroflexota bacterium]
MRRFTALAFGIAAGIAVAIIAAAREQQAPASPSPGSTEAG